MLMSRTQEVVAILALIVAVFACIAGYLALIPIIKPTPISEPTAIAPMLTPSKTIVVLPTAQPPAAVTATRVPPTPTPDLWQFYVDDIKSTIPNAPVTADTLKEIARKIPASVPFLAEAEVGLIPYQYNWRILDREGPVFLNAPEGGYAYIAWGYGNVRTNEFSVNFQGIEGNDHLVLVVGKPDDGTPTDLNTPLQLSDFHAGFAGTNFAAPAKGQVFPNRKVVKAWLSQQLWWAAKHSSITVTIWDVSNGKRFIYGVNPSNFAWIAK
jgi:hypothetical protein